MSSKRFESLKWKRTPVGKLYKHFRQDRRERKLGYTTAAQAFLAGKHPFQGRQEMYYPLIKKQTPAKLIKFRVKLPYPTSKKAMKKTQITFPGIGIGANLGPEGPLGPDLIFSINIDRQKLKKFVSDVDNLSSILLNSKNTTSPGLDYSGRMGDTLKTKKRKERLSRASFKKQYGSKYRSANIYNEGDRKKGFVLGLPLALRFQKYHKGLIVKAESQINRIVPKDSGQLRKSIMAGLKYGQEEVFDFPIRMLLLTDLEPYNMLWSEDMPDPKAMWIKPVLYASPVNNMPNEWLKHYMTNHDEEEEIWKIAGTLDNWDDLWRRAYYYDISETRKKNARDVIKKRLDWAKQQYRRRIELERGIRGELTDRHLTYNKREQRMKGQRKRNMLKKDIDRSRIDPAMFAAMNFYTTGFPSRDTETQSQKQYEKARGKAMQKYYRQVLETPQNLWDPEAESGFWETLISDFRTDSIKYIERYLHDIQTEISATLGISKEAAESKISEIFTIHIGRTEFKIRKLRKKNHEIERR